MSRQRDTDDDQHLDVHVDTIMSGIELDDDVSITLVAWQWIALGKLAEHHGVTVNTIVQRWVREQIDRLVTHVATSTPGVTPPR